MTIAHHNVVALRLGFTALLVGGWLYGINGWMDHPNGAQATVLGLVGFALLGGAAWAAPIEHRGARIGARAVGTLVSVAALALCTLLILLLRAGL